MLKIGMLVIVMGSNTGYNGCIGKLRKLEHIPELHQTISVLEDVKCKDGKERFDFIVGIRDTELRPYDSGGN